MDGEYMAFRSPAPSVFKLPQRQIASFASEAFNAMPSFPPSHEYQVTYPSGCISLSGDVVASIGHEKARAFAIDVAKQNGVVGLMTYAGS